MTVSEIEYLIKEHMSDTKPLLASKTFWGGFIGTATGVIGLIGGYVPAVQSVLDSISALPLVPPHVQLILATVGGGLAIIGRLFANKPIAGIVTSPDA